MSSSEQAPEPTMDEILASIRKIISDDEPGDAQQPEAAAPETAAPADDGLADDLANALGDAPPAQEPGDDILDLTEVVPEQPQPEAAAPDMPTPEAPAAPEAPQGDALQAALQEVDEVVSSAYYMTAQIKCDGKLVARLSFTCTVASPDA